MFRQQRARQWIRKLRACKGPCLEEGNCVCARSRAALLNKDKVKLLSPHNRLVIALHSRGGPLKPDCLSALQRKRLESWREELRTRFSLVRFERKNRGITPFAPIFSTMQADFSALQTCW